MEEWFRKSCPEHEDDLTTYRLESHDEMDEGKIARLKEQREVMAAV